MIEEAAGKTSEILEFKNSITVIELKNKFKSIYPKIANKDYQVAVNQTIVDNNITIDSDSEIALLPPFAGG